MKKPAIPTDLSIPIFLRREVTPQTKAAVTRAIKDDKLLHGMRRVEKSEPSSISAGHALNLDETGKAILKEINQAKEQRKKQAFAHLRELADAKRREKVMSQQTIGPKEAQLQASRASTVPPPKKTPEQLAEAIRQINGKTAKTRTDYQKHLDKVRDRKAPKKAQAFVAPAPTKKTNGTINALDYDWAKNEALAKAGKIPALGPWKSYDYHMKNARDLCMKGDAKAARELMDGHRNKIPNRDRFYGLLKTYLNATKKHETTAHRSSAK